MQRPTQQHDASKHFREVDPKTIGQARSLRKRSTDVERILWGKLSREQTTYRFRRQHPIGTYIVDFACTKQKLVIELDGGQHAARVEYDAKRTAFLEQQGYRVLRFWNHEVLENIDGVLYRIWEALGVLDNKPTASNTVK